MRLANAPVSFGIFGLTDSAALPGAELARRVAEQGYVGIDSGPIGLYGDDEQTVELLGSLGLALCGGWIDLPFSRRDAFEQRLPELDAALDFFAVCEHAGLGPVLPTLADSGSSTRAARPGTGENALSDDEWQTFGRNLAIAADRVRERGLVPTFHPHVGTYVETPAEIERLLSISDVELTLDTGHLMLAGGDPLAAVDEWGDRINHVHLKDVHPERFFASAAEGADMTEAWRTHPFTVLGSGMLPFAEFMDRLAARSYPGWVVVEQDAVIVDPMDVSTAIADQRTNRECLRPWFP